MTDLTQTFTHLGKPYRIHAYPTVNPGGSTSYAVEVIMPGGAWESVRLYKTPEMAMAAARAHIRRHGNAMWQGKQPRRDGG